MTKTALYDEHVKLNAKIVDFAGFDMPVQYSNVIDEHKCTRNKVGLFDISHMGEFEVKGSRSLSFLQKVLSNDISKLEIGKAMYTCMLNEQGGLIDDLFIYRLDTNYFYLVVNAGNIEKDLKWLVSNKNYFEDVMINDVSDKTAKLDLQGPLSEEVLLKIGLTDLPVRFSFKEYDIDGIKTMVSRTGYTAEDGFELYFNIDESVKMWNYLLEVGTEFGIQPIGLGARDTLRLEACYSLYGHDVTEKITPYEAGIGFTVKLNKDFIGKEALLKQKQEGIKRKVHCIEMIDRAVPREHYKVQVEGKEIGYITSGTFSPLLNKGIAMAMLHSNGYSEVDVIIRDKTYKAKVVNRPFYKYKGGV